MLKESELSDGIVSGVRTAKRIIHNGKAILVHRIHQEPLSRLDAFGNFYDEPHFFKVTRKSPRCNGLTDAWSTG
ncbi:hypothetical protein D3C84_965870 [compost metagenome]